MTDLSGRTALVTGASSGLGAHFARVLHDAGATVVLAARRVARMDAAVAAFGERAHTIAMDVADEASILEGFERIEASVGTCDIIVNNAGISGDAFALKMPTEQWDRVIDINLRAPFIIAREGAKRLAAAKKPGSIINVASVLGLRGSPQVAAYMASKAGLIHLTHALALEFARFRIRVNAIAPGYFKTEISADFLESEHGQALVARIPQRAIGELEHLTGPLLLLASDAGAYMTGSIVVVDGGLSINSL